LLSAPGATLRELDLSGRILLRGEAWAPFAEAQSLAGLESLKLDRCELGPAGLRAVVGSPHLAGLRRLSLEGDRWKMGPEGVRALTATGLPALEVLSLYGQDGGAGGLEALAA